MSIDYREFSTEGLLIEILFNLQSIDQKLGTLVPAIQTDGATVPSIKTWRLTVVDDDRPLSFEELARMDQVVSIVVGDTETVVVYAGQRVREAEEVEPGL